MKQLLPITAEVPVDIDPITAGARHRKNFSQCNLVVCLPITARVASTPVTDAEPRADQQPFLASPSKF